MKRPYLKPTLEKIPVKTSHLLEGSEVGVSGETPNGDGPAIGGNARDANGFDSFGEFE